MRLGMERDLRIGAVGPGGLRGCLLKHAHKPGHGSRVVAACDLDPAALARAQADYGADLMVTRDYDELLRMDLDAVFVLTPDFLHEAHAVAALETGKAVFLEKPMAITLAGCDRILETARRTGTRLYLGHNMRHMDFVLRMKRMIDEGAIGEVKAVWCRHFVGHGGDFYFKDWHADRRNTTSLLLQKGAHDIDIILWLAGARATRVQAMGGLTVYDKVADRHSETGTRPFAYSLDNWPPLSQKGLAPIVDVEDLSLVNMQLENGVFASYQQCHFTPDYWRNYTIIGTEGRIENFGNGGETSTVVLWNRRRLGYAPVGDRIEPVPAAVGGHGGADPRIVDEFLRYVRSGGRVSTSPVAARESVAVGCLATESLRNGGIPLDIPALPADLVAWFDR